MKRMGKSQSGQALLIVLLLMAVALTVGLTVVSRSSSDIRLSQQEEESARAFSAAEAGIEKALSQGLGLGETLTGTIGTGGYSVDFAVDCLPQGGGRLFDFGGGKFSAGETQTLWLVEHNTDGSLSDVAYFPASGSVTVCWGAETTIDANTPAMEGILIYKSGGAYKIGRIAFDPSTTRSNGFAGVDDVDGGNCSPANLAFAKNINLNSDLGLPADALPYALRLKFFYNNLAQPLAVSGTADFPGQGKCCESTASLTSGVTRKIRQCEFYKSPLAIFDYVLYSEGDLIK